MELFEKETYKKADISGKEKSVKTKVTNFVKSFLSDDIETNRERLAIALDNRLVLHACVDYIMENLPAGVERVDGDCIKPILTEVVNKKIAELPVIEEEALGG